jgi:hypothetical protein
MCATRLPFARRCFFKTGVHVARATSVDSGAKTATAGPPTPASARSPHDAELRQLRPREDRPDPACGSPTCSPTTAARVIRRTTGVEDLYPRVAEILPARAGSTEEITAAYADGAGPARPDGLPRRTGYLGGVRVEGTRRSPAGWVRARVLSTTAQQTADPVGWAARDYAGNYRENPGKYTKAFPSFHAFHDVTPNLKAHVSFSTSFGRAASPTNSCPAETPNETNRDPSR